MPSIVRVLASTPCFSTEQAAIIASLKPFADNPNLRVFCTSTDAESVVFSKQILDIITSAGLKPNVSWGQTVSSEPKFGIEIGIRDIKNPPPLAIALLVAFKNAGITVEGIGYPLWPEASQGQVNLDIFPIPASE